MWQFYNVQVFCDNFITVRYFVTVPVISLSLSTVFLSLFIILEFQVFLQSAINSNLSFIHFQQWIDLLIVEKGYFQFLRYIPFPSLIKILNFPHYSNILRASWYMWSFSGTSLKSCSQSSSPYLTLSTTRWNFLNQNHCPGNILWCFRLHSGSTIWVSCFHP